MESECDNSKIVNNYHVNISNANIQGLNLGNNINSSGSTYNQINTSIEYNDKTFINYLNNIKLRFNNWYQLNEINILENLNPEILNPLEIHYFTNFPKSDFCLTYEEYTLEQLLRSKAKIKVIVGESGIGKSTLLKNLTYKKSVDCLEFSDKKIPIHVHLKNLSFRKTLEKLILSKLEMLEYKINNCSLINLLNKNFFTFILDGYDEFSSDLISLINNEISEICNNFENCNFIISTRKNRIPKIDHGSIYFSEILPLKKEVIEKITEKYLLKNIDFLYHIEHRELEKESSNFLLLLMMISIFKKDEKLPSSISGISFRIFEMIKEREDIKGTKNKIILNWQTIERILSEIGFYIFQKSENLSLDESELKTTLKDILNNLEKEREIQTGIDIYSIIEILLSTGILILENSTFSFWHRLFLNLFTSKALLERIIKDINYIDNLKLNPKWSDIIVGAVYYLNDATFLIQKITDDINLSCRCIYEAKNVEKSLVREIVGRLIEKFKSEIPRERINALTNLKKVNIDEDTFWNLFNSSIFLDVKLVAFEEIAKQRTEKAKLLIYEKLDWDEFCYSSIKSSKQSIVKALSYFGKPEYIKILEICKKYNDSMVQITSRDIFINLIRENKISFDLIEEILDLAFNIGENKEILSSITTDILIEYNNETIIDKFFDYLEKADVRNHHHYIEKSKVLAQFKSEYLINKIFDKIISSSSEILKVICSEALVESKGYVPLEYFIEMTKDKIRGVKIHGIEGLGRFSFNEIKDYIPIFLNSDDSFLQIAAFRAMDKNGLINEVIENGLFPETFFYLSIFSFLHSVNKYRLKNSIPILDSFLIDLFNAEEDTHNRKKLIIKIAHTLKLLGYNEKAKQLINYLYKDNELNIDFYDGMTLLELIIDFDKSYATKIITDIYNKFEEKIETFLLESLEQIGTPDLKDLMKKIAKNNINKALKDSTELHSDIEGCLRTLWKIGTSDDEEWLINTITKWIETPKSKGLKDKWDSSLRRGIECLGLIGSKKALIEIKKIAREYRNNTYIINTCFSAYENIIKRHNLTKEFAEKSLFD